MKINMIAILSLLIFPSTALAQVPWDNGRLEVSENGRYFQQEDGTPFFWTGDTVWLLAQKLDRQAVDDYFRDRQQKGFNVVQTVVLQMLDDRNVYGDPALIEGNLSALNITPGSSPDDPLQYDYWDHADYILSTAEKYGIYVAVAPTWGHTVRRAPITAEQIDPYIRVLVDRWKDRPNVIWVNGGSARGTESADVWTLIGERLKSAAPHQLVTFHTFGRTQSSSWFHQAEWLDFNMFTSGHRRYDQDVEGRRIGEDNWRYVQDDIALSPAKPTLDGEPAYENTPQGLHNPSEPYWTDNDTRRYAYWSVFAGAAGHTYGENSVRQVFLPTDTASASGARGYFEERLQSEGARSMVHLKRLILSRPFLERIGDQAPVASDEGEGYDRILVTRGHDYLMAYTYTGRSFELTLGQISGRRLAAWWFNPRTGQTQSAGSVPNQGVHRFSPPGTSAPGHDWVLVLDDAAKAYPAPGRL